MHRARNRRPVQRESAFRAIQGELRQIAAGGIARRSSASGMARRLPRFSGRDQGQGPRIRQKKAELFLSICRIERGRGSRQGRRQKRHDRLGPVGQGQGHAVAPPNAQLGQAARERFDLSPQFAVGERQPRVRSDECRAFRRALRHYIPQCDVLIQSTSLLRFMLQFLLHRTLPGGQPLLVDLPPSGNPETK